jgi:hypothetical protein
MAGVRDPARVLDARVRKLIADTEPAAGRRWADRTGQLADPELTVYWRAVGAAIDCRIQRLGEHTAVRGPVLAILRYLVM